jgi:hypothetical protein
MILQLPSLNPGDFEKWVAAALVVGGAVLLFRSIFGKPENEYVRQEEFRTFRIAVEHDLGGLRDRIDSRHLALIENLERLGSTLMQQTTKQSEMLETRLRQLESAVARLEERTRE